YTSISYEIDGNSIVLNTSQLTEGEREFILYTATAGYKVDVVNATKIIYTKQDFDDIRIYSPTRLKLSASMLVPVLLYLKALNL
ncbi:MAG: hypothetical protein PHE60_12445, partial [Sulfurospirillaceae bacterium]|nr:hypothetical protein [Sulfurospirillaceae bacterium]